MAVWPPTLPELKNERSIDVDDTLDQDALQRALDAAVDRVEHVRSDLDFTVEVPATVHLGTLRLASRWFVRRNSPDAVVEMGELGSGRVPSFDPDIEQLLGVGRYRRSVIA